MSKKTNIQDLKRRVRISDWLRSQGFKEDTGKSKPGEIWFFSPFYQKATGADEGHASFQVIEGNQGFQLFKDHGSYGPQKGGDIFNLVQELHSVGFKEALDIIQGAPAPAMKTDQTPVVQAKPDPKLSLFAAYPFSGGKGDFYQKDYCCRQRGISWPVVNRYISRVNYMHKGKGKKYWAAGWMNESGGYDIRAKAGQIDIKACLEVKDITVIGGEKLKPNDIISRVSIFEGMFDFMTILTWLKKEKLEGVAIILNGNGLLQKALDFMSEYQVEQILIYTDNDRGGEETEFKILEWAEENEIPSGSMRYLYDGFKDANEMHIHEVIGRKSPTPLVGGKFEPKPISQDQRLSPTLGQSLEL